MPAGRAVGTATAGGAVAGAAGAAASTGAAAGGAEAAAAAGRHWDCWDCRALEAGPNRAAEWRQKSSSKSLHCQGISASLEPARKLHCCCEAEKILAHAGEGEKKMLQFPWAATRMQRCFVYRRLREGQAAA